MPLSERLNLNRKKKAKFIKKIHEDARRNIERHIEKYTKQANKRRREVVFELGDWVWLHMHKERFLEHRISKLLPRGDGPFQVIKRINNNTYQLDLHGEYNISATFNVADLSPFIADTDLRTNHFDEEKDDAIMDSNQSTSIIEALEGPMTRVHTKRFEEQLNLFMESFFKEQTHTRDSQSTCLYVVRTLKEHETSKMDYVIFIYYCSSMK